MPTESSNDMSRAAPPAARISRGVSDTHPGGRARDTGSSSPTTTLAGSAQHMGDTARCTHTSKDLFLLPRSLAGSAQPSF